MLWSLLLAAFYSLPSVVQATVLPLSYPNKTTDEVRNANHIFNAIHSSMRQWGSSLNHNGMSLFPATVPARTQFYHGNPFKGPVEGLEWLAFEPEHAIMFARRMQRPDGNSMWRTGGTKAPTHQRPLSTPEAHMRRPVSSNSVSMGEWAASPRPEPPRIEPGWLHTYRTKEATPLLYIDGTSTGKCDKGTLDSQDVLLLNASSEGRGAFWEGERANRLCKLAREHWHGKIKGFIRVEAGFEIIMCSFSDSLDFVQSIKAGHFSPDGAEVDLDNKGLRWSIWEWVKFVTARYDGIGGGRVKLDYDNFVTAYNYDLDLFRAEADLPRLANLSVASLDVVRNDIDKMIQSWDPARTYAEGSRDWQSITDMVVERYGKMLKYFVSGSLTTSQELLDELQIALRVFVDSDARNTTAEVDRCVAQFNPTDDDIWRSIAGRSIHVVTRRICETLFAVFDVDMLFSESLETLWMLVHWLDWSVWKRCPDCPFDEVCFIPMWPFGAAEDRENPQCRNATGLEARMGYCERPHARQMEFGE